MSARPFLLVAVAFAAFTAQASAQVTAIHSFEGASDGSYPNGTLVRSSDGYFYGTVAGGSGGVYRSDRAGNVVGIAGFDGANGRTPVAGVVEGSDGNFYGTASVGGIYDRGTIFRMTPQGVLTVLHSFSGGAFNPSADGGAPVAPLIRASDGYLYGTTAYGGAHAAGTIFRISEGGDFTLLHSFDPLSTGRYPNSGLVQASDGFFYATAQGSSFVGGGTVVRMDGTGTVVVLKILAPTFDFLDPAGPLSALMQGTDGFLYGVTSYGGAFSGGTAFRVSTGGTYTLLHSFNEATEGRPRGTLAQAPDGALFGLAEWGGRHGDGTVFRMTTSGTVTKVEPLRRAATGAGPDGALLPGDDGFFYGVATQGGEYDKGVILRIDVAAMGSSGGGDPDPLVATLRAYIEQLPINPGLKAGLLAKCNASVGRLTGLIREVKALPASKLSAAAAAQIEALASAILAALGG